MNIPNGGTLEGKEYDEWRCRVYKIYGEMLKEMVSFREKLVRLRIDQKLWKKKSSKEQEILEEDLKLSQQYIKMVYTAWSSHLVDHMHRGWEEANTEMQKLYLMMKRNYKVISRMAQIYEDKQKEKEAKLEAERREKEERTFGGPQPAADSSKRRNQNESNISNAPKPKMKKLNKIKKFICKRWTKAEYDHFKGSKRLLRGLKNLYFHSTGPVGVHSLSTKYIKFVRVYMNRILEEDIDEEELESAQLSEVEGVKFEHVEPLQATEFKRIFTQIQNCVTSLQTTLDNRNGEYMTHIRSVISHLDFSPKLIVDVVNKLVPVMLNMEEMMEKPSLRRHKMEVINEAFGVLAGKRRQIAHTPELAKKLPSIDECIGNLFASSFKQIQECIDILQKRIDEEQEPLEDGSDTFEDIQDEFMLLAIAIMKYCPQSQFQEAFNKNNDKITNELVDPIVALMKFLNTQKRYDCWEVCCRGIMGKKDDLINPDRSKRTAGSAPSVSSIRPPKKPTRSYFRGRGRGRGLCRGGFRVYRGRGFRGRGRGSRYRGRGGGFVCFFI